MEEKNVINVKQKDGTTKQAEPLAMFKLNSTNKKYMIYTYKEVDANDLITLNVAELVSSENGHILDNVQTDEEWTEIKKVIKTLINRGDQG